MLFSKFKVTTRLGIAFGIFLISLIIIVVISLDNVNRTQEDLNRVVNDINVKVAVVSSMIDMIKDVQIYTRNIALVEDARAMRDQLKKLQAARNLYDESESRLDGIFVTEEDKTQLAKIKELRARARPMGDRAIELGLQNRDKEATSVIINEVAPITEKRLDALMRVLEQQKGEGKKVIEEVAAAQSRAKILIFSLGVLALVLGMLVTSISIFFGLGIDKASVVPGREM